MRYRVHLLPAFICCLCLALGLALPVPAAAAQKAAGTPLTVGLMPYLSTRTLLRTHEPLVHSLEQQLNRPVQLRTAPDYPTFFRRLRDGAYDIVISAPHYGWLAIKDYGYQPLLVHKEPIRGVLVTAAAQPLTRTDELRGGTIAVTDRSALMAILGALSLADEGLIEGRDYRFVSAVSHSSAIQNAVMGKTRAALVNSTGLLLSPSEIRDKAVIWRELAVFPGQFYIAHPRMLQDELNAVRSALLGFEQSAAGREFFTTTRQGGYRALSAEDRAQLDRSLPETRRLLREALAQ